MRSEQINELATALSKAQSAFKGAKKDSENPFYKSRYADLESIWEAIRKPLTDNGLCVTQTVDIVTKSLITTLLHSSGQWIDSAYPILTKDDSAQALGSGMSYARRYSLAAMVGVYQTDDDGEAAQARPQQQSRPQGATNNVQPNRPVSQGHTGTGRTNSGGASTLPGI